MNLAEARQAIADALNTVPSLNVKPRPSRAIHRLNDGWVQVSRIAPATYTECAATFTAYVSLGSDEALAEQRFEEIGTAVVDALTKSPTLYTSDVFVEPIDLALANGSGSVYALSINLSLEVS